MTSKSFNISLRKGYIGESVVTSRLEAKGFIVYRPYTDGAHAFDMLAIKNKERVIALDIKSKARFNKLPATGVDIKHFNEYIQFSNRHNMPFWLVFVDEMMGSVYGNTLRELEKPRVVYGKRYPFNIKTKFSKTIRVWPIEAMLGFCKIDEEKVLQLKGSSQRNYDYLW